MRKLFFRDSKANLLPIKTSTMRVILTILRRSVLRWPAGLALSFLLSDRVSAAPAEDLNHYFQSAQAALKAGATQEALVWAERAVKAAPTNARSYAVRGEAFDALRRRESALADFNEALRLKPDAWALYHSRGGVHFKLGRFAQSVADFNKFLEKYPDQTPYHWQRGLSFYYAGRYEDGWKQFELHQTVNSNDVENAVWHFLCLAKAGGVDAARKKILPIKEDRRIPMMTIYDLYRDRATPEDVLKAAEAGSPSPAVLKEQLFYAHLYLGLYFDSVGNPPKAREHIDLAANRHFVNSYMGDVARVDLARR